MKTNASYNGGLTRQFGNLSFSRIFQAGHEGSFLVPLLHSLIASLTQCFIVSYYQPETTYQIFNRVLSNLDVATGLSSILPTSNSSTYFTAGNSSVLKPIGAPIKFESDAPSCYLWDIMETCTAEQTQVFGNGSAITEDFIVVGYTLEDGSKVFYNQTADIGSGSGGGSDDGSSPQPYVPASRASHASAVDLALTALVAAIVAVVM